VAVIGGGVAGLMACRALADRSEVTLLEAGDQPGGHVHTAVDPATGAAVDLGFIVWNRLRYPRFGAVLDQLGVRSQPAEMSFSVRRDDGSLEYGSRDLAALLSGAPLSPRRHRFVLRVVRFLARARRDLRAGVAAGRSLDDYLAAARIPDDVGRDLVAPLAGALWSMAPEAIGDFPAETFLRFLDQHGMLRALRPLPWLTVAGGARRYVDALLAALPARVLLGTPVTAVEPDAGGVTVRADGAELRVDRAILAVHPDTALALLASPTDDERAVLGAFRLSDNRAVLHTDQALLPQAPAARASWNYVVHGDRTRVSVTYDMSRLQGIAGPTRYLVTLNPRRPIDADRVIARARFAHPLLDATAVGAQAALPRLQGARRVYFAGAWSGYGFHEDGARAGLAAAARLWLDGAGAATAGNHAEAAG